MERPLVYLFVSIIIGDLCGILFQDFLIIDVAIAASFFIFMFIISQKKLLFFELCFFLIGFFSLLLYFHSNLRVQSTINVRVINKNKYYTTASYIGRKINIRGNLPQVNIGENANIKGYFNKNIDYEYGTIGDFKVVKVNGKSHDLLTKMYFYKQELFKKFDDELGKDFSSKIMAVAFGDSSELSQNDKDNFKRLGIVYAICVSGLHMLIVFKTLQLCFNLEISILMGIFYTLFTGCQPATVRALIMIIVLKYSKKINKNYDVYSALSLAGMILLLFRPYYILDIGFMLSFLSTFGIALFYKKISRFFYKLPKKINESLSISLSVQSISMPYVLFTIKNFSLGFALGNIVLIPMFSLLVALGNVALIFSFFKPLFKIICIPIYVVLTALNGASNILLNITPKMLYIPLIDTIFIMYLYFCYILARKGYRNVKYGAILFFSLILINTYSFTPKISYLDLKSGYGFILRYKFNTILISNYEIINNDEKEELQGRFCVNKFVTNKNFNYNILMKNRYLVYIPKYQGDKKVMLKVKDMATKRNMVYFYDGTVRYYGINSTENYDIIKEDDNIKAIDLPVDNLDFDVINNKVVVIKK
ncbi:competence protein ComEC [Clostridium acidisoli DSM 12555]|uniref:Competence protein ComEC n=1 Tax=Clostridium acidisoli DSM 12555 TaxID=1121291 RepID=A0A1W1X580_9CLOT|nr:ComEC/Rec2 family competence protein [Clostridium acidisoli]SMC19007.1 competence protein ComEC [Clostridium acidisoli DSM 12555]